MTPEIKGYSIQREVGKGGMGMVYQARRDDGLVVALKVLPPHLVNPINARRFQREGRALQALDHPNIVGIHDIGSHEGWHYIAMELVEGKPLSRILRETKSIAVELASSIAVQIARALKVIHDNRMIHRDLKPSNVIVNSDHAVKLLDFGLVQVDGLTMLTTTGNVVGTPAYMSPEQCSGTPLDHRSDIYSFGALLYELLTGAPPFVSESIYDVLEMHKTAPPDTPSSRRKNVPADLEQLTLHCLEKHPDQRPQSMDEILLALNSGATPSFGGTGTAPVAGAYTGARPSSSKSPRRRRLGKPSGKMVAMLLVWVIGGTIGFLAMHPVGEAFRQRVADMIRPEEKASPDLKGQVQQRYAALTQAEAAFAEGTKLEAAGDDRAAYRKYRQAAQTFPERPAYFDALVRIAGSVGKTSEVQALVSKYLDSSAAQDPHGKLQQWLDTGE